MTETLTVKVTCDKCGCVWEDEVGLESEEIRAQYTDAENDMLRRVATGLTRPDCPACTPYLLKDGKLVRK